MTRFGDTNYRDVPGRGDMPGRVPGDPQYAEDGPEPDDEVRGYELIAAVLDEMGLVGEVG